MSLALYSGTVPCEECGRLFWPSPEQGDRWCSEGCRAEACRSVAWIDRMTVAVAVVGGWALVWLLGRAVVRWVFR